MYENISYSPDPVEKQESILSIDTHLEVLAEKTEETLTIKEIEKKREKNTLDLTKTKTQTIQDILTFLTKNKETFTALETITVPEAFIAHDTNLKLLLNLMDMRKNLTIKTDKGYDVPRPPKSL